MSQRALLLAVAAHLRTQLSLGTDECSVELNARPQPINGELFIAVHPGSWVGQSGDDDLDELFGVQVSVTRRITYAPEDRQAEDVLTGTDAIALEKLLEQIRVNLHMNYAVINAANTTIGGSANGFIEPLRFHYAQPPQVVGSEWFGSDDGEPQAGLVQTLVFDGSRRVQTLASMT